MNKTLGINFILMIKYIIEKSNSGQKINIDPDNLLLFTKLLDRIQTLNTDNNEYYGKSYEEICGAILESLDNVSKMEMPSMWS